MKILLSLGVILAIIQVSPLVKGDTASTPPTATPRILSNVKTLRPSVPLSSVFTDSGGTSASQVQSLLKLKLDKRQLARSVVEVNGKLTKLDPNVNGTFARIWLNPKQTVSVAAIFPQLSPGDRVLLEANDGGFMGLSDQVEVMPVDSNGQLAFTFTAGTNDGIYRVTLRHGSTVHELNFWVGKDLVYGSRNLPVKK
jgi:hypothetical protein